MRHRVLINQDEDGMFVVACPSFPDCISQGKTRKEAIENIQDAIKFSKFEKTQRTYFSFNQRGNY